MREIQGGVLQAVQELVPDWDQLMVGAEELQSKRDGHDGVTDTASVQPVQSPQPVADIDMLAADSPVEGEVSTHLRQPLW